MCACNYNTSPSVCVLGGETWWVLPPKHCQARSMTTNEDRHQLLLKGYRPIRKLLSAVASYSESTSPQYYTNLLVFWPAVIHCRRWIGTSQGCPQSWCFCAQQDYSIKCCQLIGETCWSSISWHSWAWHFFISDQPPVYSSSPAVHWLCYPGIHCRVHVTYSGLFLI